MTATATVIAAKAKTAPSKAKAAKAKPLDRETSLKNINGNIALLRKNSNAFRDLLQKTVVMICRHGKEFGDVSAMARLMNDGLSNWYRRGPLCNYINDFTPIVVVFKQGVAVAKLEDKAERKDWNIDGMNATPFWEHKSLDKDNELPLDINDVDTNVTKLADRLTKQLKEGKIAEAAKEHTNRLIAALRGTIATVREADRANAA